MESIYLEYNIRQFIFNMSKMRLKIPEVHRCCFCIPLRRGIIIFGFLNIILSLLAVSCFIVTTELKRSTLTSSSVEVIVATVLYGILGMGVILNILLLIAGYQKDASMLRLYNYYALATTFAALIPICILVSRLLTIEVCAAPFAIIMQVYVIILVRSEIVKLEQEQMKSDDCSQEETDRDIDEHDTQILI